MDLQQRRHCYSVKFKLEVIAYAKEHGNRASERNFGSPPTVKMVRNWSGQEDELKAVVGKRDKKCLLRGIVKWPELENELRTWVVSHRSLGICVSTKMIVHHSRESARSEGIQDFKGMPTWCYEFMG